MHLLEDLHLIDCYQQAERLHLDEQFIRMLLDEIRRRDLNPAARGKAE